MPCVFVINCKNLYRVGQKSKRLLIYQQIMLKPADEVTFSLNLNVEQATGVNANKNLLLLNILWYSAADTRMCRSSTRAINTDVQVQFNLTSYQVHS